MERGTVLAEFNVPAGSNWSPISIPGSSRSGWPRDFGGVGVVVDAKPEAVAFDAKLGFVPLAVTAGQLGDRPEPLPMFLEVDLASAATGSSGA